MKKALILGIKGQDGSLLAELLLKKKYKITGISRKKFGDHNLKKLKIRKNLKILCFNYLDKKRMQNLLKKNDFDEIYFFAGQPLPNISNEKSLDTLNSNIIPVFNILLSIYNFNLKSKFFNACSCEIFGINNHKVNEKTIKKPVSVYGLSKLVSLELVKFFREKFNIKCCSGILFHHESMFRKNNFVIKKLVKEALKIKKNKNNKIKKIKFGNTDVIKDWGWAPEYVSIMNKILNSRKIEDYIICSGSSKSLNSVISYTFKILNLNWENFVTIDKNLKRKNDIKFSRGDNNKLYKNLKIKPKYSIFNVIDKLIEAEFQWIKR